MKKLIIILIIVITLLLFGCTQQPNDNSTDINTTSTFREVDNSICTIDGKPIIRLYSTTWCPHCKWINDTYNNTVMEYVEKGEIVAHHFKFDINDDVLTPGIDGIQQTEIAVFEKFSPKGSIPAFVFGCKYYRIGNGYEAVGSVSAENNQKRLDQEEKEFRKLIEKLIEEAKTN